MIIPVAVQSCRLIPALLLLHADLAGAKPRRDHRFLDRVSRHEVPKTPGNDDAFKLYDPARVSHISVSLSARHPSGVAGSLAMPDPRVIGATPLDLWLRSGHPQGVPASTPVSTPSRRVPALADLSQWVPTPIDFAQRVPVLTDFARLVVDPEATTSHRLMDPDRDPRFIATGRAAIAAMTCGQINVRTSTPCGSQSLSLRCAATRMGARSEINSHTSVLATLWFDRCLGNGHPCGCSHACSQMRSPVRDSTSRWLLADGEPPFLNPVLDFSITGFSVDYYRL